MEDLEGKNLHSAYYSTKGGVRVEHDTRDQGPQEGEFCLIIVEHVGEGKLQMDEANELEQRVQAMIG